MQRHKKYLEKDFAWKLISMQERRQSEASCKFIVKYQSSCLIKQTPFRMSDFRSPRMVRDINQPNGKRDSANTSRNNWLICLRKIIWRCEEGVSSRRCKKAQRKVQCDVAETKKRRQNNQLTCFPSSRHLHQPMCCCTKHSRVSDDHLNGTQNAMLAS